MASASRRYSSRHPKTHDSDGCLAYRRSDNPDAKAEDVKAGVRAAGDRALVSAAPAPALQKRVTAAPFPEHGRVRVEALAGRAGTSQAGAFQALTNLPFRCSQRPIADDGRRHASTWHPRNKIPTRPSERSVTQPSAATADDSPPAARISVDECRSREIQRRSVATSGLGRAPELGHELGHERRGQQRLVVCREIRRVLRPLPASCSASSLKVSPSLDCLTPDLIFCSG
jgi:hypothetical protein